MQPKPDTFRLWRSARLDSLTLMHAEYSRHEFARHWHDTYVIQIVEAGRNLCECQGQPYQIVPGMLLVIHPHEVHDGRSAGGETLRYRSIYPTSSFWRVLFPDHSQPEFPARLWTDARLVRQFREAHRLLETNPDCPEGELLMLQFCTALLEKQNRPRREHSESVGPHQLDRARRLLESSFVPGVSTSELAREAGLSLFHFIRAFTQAYRLTPHEYLVNLRVERARQLLQRTSAPLSEVSASAGFCDQSHLNRHFRRVVGVSPGVYRRSVRSL